MEPLVTRKEHTAWMSWQALVELMRFTVKHSFELDTAPAEFRRLADNLLRSFDAVEEWQGYEKPKLHPPQHFAEALEEHGPPRTHWCLPWEAYLQVLKRVFEMGSAKSACYRMGLFWAVKSVMNYRDRHRAAWHEDSIDVRPESVWRAIDSTLSPFDALLAKDHRLLRVRSLRSVVRWRERFTVGDWLLVQDDAGNGVIGRLRDLMQAEMHEQAVVRMWLDGCADPRYGERGELWSAKPDYAKCMCIELENVHLTYLRRQEHAKYDVYII